MNTSSISTTLPLAHQATLSIDDPAGLDIRATRGSLWLTFDGQQRDIILVAGSADASYAATERRRALIYALSDAELSVTAAATQSVGSQSAQLHARDSRNSVATLLPLAAA